MPALFFVGITVCYVLVIMEGQDACKVSEQFVLQNILSRIIRFMGWEYEIFRLCLNHRF